ncbi:Vms1/Ankzf1 family peptidyl-tRNA hydrolase [Nonomuraea sp. NBC_01738]|uniref:baeRF2 domain-containing protein n=1 Tax=Nonomuraea sp. NBC_01738 TaxID=2976003 RepID=UPI002E14D575|nr:Vms1/Ankzf1 family peptidyl-tRNA hydrolase [Nonomuraea sp. NBC_01738]
MRLDFVRPLYERQGPYVSVYTAGAGGRQRWREGVAGADAATVEAVLEHPGVDAGFALFAARGEVVLAEPFSGPPGWELACWSPLPRVTPMLAGRGENVPHLRVIADGAGVEVTAYGGGSPRTATESAVPWPLQKTARGGWARRVYDRYGHAEPPDGSWERVVAREVDEQVRRIGAELVVMAGEPVSRANLRDRLGVKAAGRVLMVEHSVEHRVEHGARSERHEFAKDAESALDRWFEARRAELLDRHRAASGPVGLVQVAHALREGRAHAVLTPGELERRVWIGPGGTQLAAGAEELLGWGVEDLAPERADSALARAAAMTDAELWFCPDLDDVAAVIRY